MSNEVAIREDDLPAIADDFLIQIADQAERRIDAVIKIKQVALKVTNARDWTDQNGNPYLQVSGSEKIANLFSISWRIEEPKFDEEPDGHFTYSIKGEFSLGGRTIEVEGTRSSKDGFFNRYDYSKPKDKETGKHPMLPPSSIDKGDVKKAALTNLYGNGITRLLGIRNLTWEDLEKFAGITQKMILGKVSYNQREASGNQPEIQEPQKKSEASSKEKVATENQKHTGTLVEVSSKSGKKGSKEWTLYGVKVDNLWFNTFDKKLADTAKEAEGREVEVEYVQTEKSKDLKSITLLQEETTECSKDPMSCDKTQFTQDDVICADTQQTCPYKPEE